MTPGDQMVSLTPVGQTSGAIRGQGGQMVLHGEGIGVWKLLQRNKIDLELLSCASCLSNNFSRRAKDSIFVGHNSRNASTWLDRILCFPYKLSLLYLS